MSLSYFMCVLKEIVIDPCTVCGCWKKWSCYTWVLYMFWKKLYVTIDLLMWVGRNCHVIPVHSVCWSCHVTHLLCVLFGRNCHVKLDLCVLKKIVMLRLYFVEQNCHVTPVFYMCVLKEIVMLYLTFVCLLEQFTFGTPTMETQPAPFRICASPCVTCTPSLRSRLQSGRCSMMQCPVSNRRWMGVGAMSSLSDTMTCSSIVSFGFFSVPFSRKGWTWLPAFWTL